MDEMKPCPFCGGKIGLIEFDQDIHTMNIKYNFYRRKKYNNCKRYNKFRTYFKKISKRVRNKKS